MIEISLRVLSQEIKLRSSAKKNSLRKLKIVKYEIFF